MPIRTPHRPSRRSLPAPPADWTADGPERTPAEIAEDARAGSARLRVFLLRYGAVHGLPNLAPAQCLATLHLLAGARTGRRLVRRRDRAIAAEARAALREVRRSTAT